MMLVKFLYLSLAIVMHQNLVVFVAFFAHHRCANLAEANAVSPACAGKRETLRNAVDDFAIVYNESRAEQMRIAQSASDFEFLSDDVCLLCSDDFQF